VARTDRRDPVQVVTDAAIVRSSASAATLEPAAFKWPESAAKAGFSALYRAPWNLPPTRVPFARVDSAAARSKGARCGRTAPA
jgi:hypothetical protein